jgi:hypothetical protein
MNIHASYKNMINLRLLKIFYYLRFVRNITFLLKETDLKLNLYLTNNYLILEVNIPTYKYQCF